MNLFKKHKDQAAQEEGLGTEKYLYHQQHGGAFVRVLGTLFMLFVVAVITLFIQGLIDGNNPLVQFFVDIHRWLFSKTTPFHFSDL